MENEISIEKALPLVPIQSGMIAESSAGSNDHYREQICVQLNPSIDDDILSARIKKIVKTNEIFRTIFDLSDGNALQIVISGLRPDITTLNISRYNDLSGILEEEKRNLKPLDIAPPIRFAIIRNKSEQYLAITYHHVLLDGSSINIILSILCDYEDIKCESSSTGQYIEWLKNNHIEQHGIETWRKLLVGLPPDDGALQMNNNVEGGIATSQLIFGRDFHNRLINRSKTMKVTPAVCMQSLWGQWLASYFNKNSILYGLVVSTRVSGVNDQALGPYMSTIPWRDRVRLGDNLIEASKEMQDRIITVDKAKHVPLRDIIRNASPYAGLFDAILNITSNPVTDKIIYTVIKTYENTGYKLSADIVITDNIGAFFSSSYMEKCQLDAALKSFFEFCNIQITKEKIVNQKTKLKITEISHITSRSPLDNIALSVAESIGIKPKDIDKTKSFIENGGDSINALRLVNLLQAQGTTCSVGNILRAVSLNEISAINSKEKIRNEFNCITNYQKRNNSKSEKPNKNEYTHAPYSVQTIVEAYNNGYGQDYHEQTAFKLLSNLKPDTMRHALHELGMEFPTLRMKYFNDDANKQELNNNPRTSLKTHVEKISFNAFIKKVSEEDWKDEINLNTGALLRVIMQPCDKGWCFFMGFSALVTDGWSFSTLLVRLFEIYGDLTKNRHIRLNDISYLNFCANAQPVSIKKSSQLSKKETSYSSDISQKEFHISTLLTKKLIERCNFCDKTICDFLINCVSITLKDREFSDIEICENGRYSLETYNSVGPYSYLSTKKIKNISSQRAYFVFENYPKDSECRLKKGHVKYFQEDGNWRRTLLAPDVTLGLSFEILGDDSITVLISVRCGNAIDINSYWKDLNQVINKDIKYGL